MKIFPYAGFWKRALAFFIDNIILAVPTFILQSLLIADTSTKLRAYMDQIKLQTQAAPTSPFPPLTGGDMMGLLTFFVLLMLLRWLYRALMESSRYQGTLGKMALGIKVVGADGNRIGFWWATCRCLARIISGNPTLNFGYYMAGFTSHRQTLHDIITNTFVVSKEYQPDQKLPALPFHTGYFILGLCVALLPVLLLVLLVVSVLLLIFQGVPA